MYYADRVDAGKQLATRLQRFAGSGSVVLALPRGGVVLGAEVAKSLHSPLGLVIARKISHPAAPEYAIGAMAENDKPIFDEQEAIMIDEDWLDQAIDYTRSVINKRRALYYGYDFTPPAVKGKTAIIVDDGIATGLTVEAAIRYVRRQQPSRLVVAVPVAQADSIRRLGHLADEIIVLDSGPFLDAVGAHYRSYPQVTNEEVMRLLREVHRDIQQTTTRRAKPTKTSTAC